MSVVQLESVSAPLDSPGVGGIALRTVMRAEAMGLLQGEPPIRRLDVDAIERVLRRVARVAGVGRGVVVNIAHAHPSAAELERALYRAYEELEHSPVPHAEWHAVVEHLGLELVTRLLGIAPASARRYAKAQRRTPDDVAERLHFLALVSADLAGSYNDFGIRRWFERPRPQLDMKSPAQLLRGEWGADSGPATQVRELARSLAGPLGT